jgi:zinc transporter, ZIP family
MEWFAEQSAVVQATVAGTFTWAMTAVGAASVAFFRAVGARLLAAMLGFAAGIMVAASFFSLLLPALELAELQGMRPLVPATVGFLVGGACIRGVDAVLPHLHPRRGLREGPRTSWRRSTLLVTALTLHNVPEGLAIGVAFGAVSAAQDLSSVQATSLGTAVALTIGIGFQNLPEGAAVAVPLRAGGFSRRRAFWYGQLSGIVEPIAAFLGALAVLATESLLPYALAFAAGSMIFVVVEELIPESQSEVAHHDLATLAFMVGFAMMMLLDIALG